MLRIPRQMIGSEKDYFVGAMKDDCEDGKVWEVETRRRRKNRTWR